MPSLRFTALVGARHLLLVGALAGCRAIANTPFYGAPPNATHPWCVHDRNQPAPAAVAPGLRLGQPPSDAIVLFDGTSLEHWVSLDKARRHQPPRWAVQDGAMVIVPGTGTLYTQRDFGDCQLHLEMALPVPAQRTGQNRGNSGLFLLNRYEVQILDSYQAATYVDGMLGAVYGQNPPLANASRPPGEWQAYDIVFRSPRFDASGQLLTSGSITVFLNGVLVQDHWAYEGATEHRQRAKFRAHPPIGPLALQDHGSPVRFRNIWIRDLPALPALSAAAITAQRAATAASLRAAAAAEPPGARKLELAMESLVYEADPPTLEQVRQLAAAQVTELTALTPAALKAREDEAKALAGAMKYLLSNALAPDSALPLAPLLAAMASAGIAAK